MKLSVRLMSVFTVTSSISNIFFFSVWSGQGGYPGAGLIPLYFTLNRSSLLKFSSAEYPQNSFLSLSCSLSANASARRLAIISIIATLHFIKLNDLGTTLEISQRLVNHPHDLIHKAVGWMLRELGKQDQSVMMEFLREHHEQMPRTMLRYAIEKLPTAQRKQILAGQI